MINYHQPDFYHFSEDSTILAREVEKYLDSDDKNILDLCAGCGVVGIELSRRLEFPHKVTFIEKQEEFRDFLETNAQEFLGHPYKIIIDDYKNVKKHEKYDVIVCNPPYFFNDESRTSTNVNKAICRSMDENEYIGLKGFIKKNSCKKVFIIGRQDGIGKKLEKDYKAVQLKENLYLYKVF